MDFATKLLSIHDGTQVIIFRHKAHIDYMKQAWVSHMANIKEVGRRVVFAHDMSQLFSSLEKEVWEVESLNGFFRKNIINRPSTLEFEQAIFEKTGNIPPIVTSLSNHLQGLEENINKAQSFIFPKMLPYEGNNSPVTRLIQDYLKVA